jgi:hypothetical protein
MHKRRDLKPDTDDEGEFRPAASKRRMVDMSDMTDMSEAAVKAPEIEEAKAPLQMSTLLPVQSKIIQFVRAPRTKIFTVTDITHSLERVTRSLQDFTLEDYSKAEETGQGITIQKHSDGQFLLTAYWNNSKNEGWVNILLSLLKIFPRVGTLSRNELILDSERVRDTEIVWDITKLSRVISLQVSTSPGFSSDIIEKIRKLLIRQFCSGSTFIDDIIFKSKYVIRISEDALPGRDVSLFQLCQIASNDPPILFTRVLNAMSAAGKFTGVETKMKKTGLHDIYKISIFNSELEFEEKYGHAPPSETETTDGPLALNEHARALYLQKLFLKCAGNLEYTWEWNIVPHTFNGEPAIVGDDNFRQLEPNILSNRSFYQFKVNCTDTAGLLRAATIFIAKLKPLFPGPVRTRISGETEINLGRIKPDPDTWNPRDSTCMYALKMGFGVPEMDPRNPADVDHAKTGFLGLTGEIDLKAPAWRHPVLTHLTGGRQKQRPVQSPRSRQPTNRLRSSSPSGKRLKRTSSPRPRQPSNKLRSSSPSNKRLKRTSSPRSRQPSTRLRSSSPSDKRLKRTSSPRPRSRSPLKSQLKVRARR